MKFIRYYQFTLRGLHSLTSLSEPTHGHLAFLNVGVQAPLSSDQEKELLCFMKNNVLKDFDKRDWRKALRGEPSGENVVLEIARRLKNQESFKVKAIELQETRKNFFRLNF